MRRVDPSDGLAAVEDLLSVKWTLPILRVLASGPVRFSGIREAIPAISARSLVGRLRALEAAGILARARLPPPANCQIYALTPLGEAARPIVHAVQQWAHLMTV